MEACDFQNFDLTNQLTQKNTDSIMKNVDELSAKVSSPTSSSSKPILTH